METRHLGLLWPVSALTLGGGGLGQLWGETTREECVATVREAVDSGITLLDMAPAYGDGEAEEVVGEAFEGSLPTGVRVTTKCRLGTPEPGEVADVLERSLTESLARMRLERVDIYFLHSNIIPDDYDDSPYEARPPTRWKTYVEEFVPAIEALRKSGRIGAWGLTGIGIPDNLLEALDLDVRPEAIQCIANAIDSAGEIQHFEGPLRAREIIEKAAVKRCGVMGIRAVQGGALTDELDRELPEDHGVRVDYERTPGLRALAAELGCSTAALAHRYALGMDWVDTVVLGVKNREELQDCLRAAEEGPLSFELMRRVEAAAADPTYVPATTPAAAAGTIPDPAAANTADSAAPVATEAAAGTEDTEAAEATDAATDDTAAADTADVIEGADIVEAADATEAVTETTDEAEVAEAVEEAGEAGEAAEAGEDTKATGGWWRRLRGR